jgi:hypothetical protein
MVNANSVLLCLDDVYDIRDLDIGHFEFVGQCFVETMMLGGAAQELETGKKMIFAIH